ncbi:serine/threonine-protein kinase [Umezawaea sp. Da 62-37]|uniref:serine/threonine-protein kinase n=1 Tax=Umezawaea sp. Da 62-37 TaxID=3075927 RepID=UPI0028F6D28B|nr:serine/threonine-protein kinase [Umezawaea sp. Da 62-37]WNV90808.1 serine/threonine-protein kinase [Umezawaea sp. Da 62-37]
MNAVGGRYLLKEQIGSGGMGVVWLAHDELLHREVAVKQLKLPEMAPVASKAARTRAMREARIAARLQHPNAIAVYDVVVEDELPWIVMEYLPSRSLAALLEENGPLSPAEAARIGGMVATALAAAHAAGIVHRDVKPGNVLIGHGGAVKLTDFGISRATGDTTITEAGALSGTPAYLAPEVARGDLPDSRSDVFSLGATLYAATEAHGPYGANENSLGLLYRAAIGKMDRPIRAGALIGPMERLLALDPAQRPTAAEAADMLSALPSDAVPTPMGIPVAVTPTPRPSQPSTPRPSSTFAQPSHPAIGVRGISPVHIEQGGAGKHGSRPKWLVPVIVAFALLVGTLIGLNTLLSAEDDRSTDPGLSDERYQESVAGTPKAVDLTPTVAGNFALGWLRSAKNETQASWDKMDPASRPTYDDYMAKMETVDEMVPKPNPEVSAKGDDYLVVVEVEVTANGRTAVEDRKVLVKLVDGELKVAEYTG